MTTPKLDKEKIKEIIINYLKKNGSIRYFSDLDIYKQDQIGVFAAFYRMGKEGVLIKKNDFYYLAKPQE